MMKKIKLRRMVPVILVVALAAIAGSCAVLGVAPSGITGPRLFGFPGDWEKIPAKTVTLFYPGQTSWEFLTSAAHPGAQAIDTGCATCHTGQEKVLGAKLVQAGPRESYCSFLHSASVATAYARVPTSVPWPVKNPTDAPTLAL